MHRFLILSFFLVCNIYLNAQNEYKYSGLISSNELAFTYYIEFKLNDNNLTGISITEKGNEHETKNKIIGLYNSDSKTYEIQELEILETNSSESTDQFCYLELKLNTINKKTLEGSFTGYFDNDSICADGKIFLMEEEKLNKIKKKIEEKIEIQEEVLLTSSDTVQLNSKKKNILITIWDSKKIDGDEITLLINNQVILEKYKVLSSKKIIPIKLNKGENNIQIIATDIGEIAPNTIGMEIIIDNVIYPFNTKLSLNESSLIQVVK